MKEIKDFFISYTGADEAWAEWIAWQLEENGYSVTIQVWDFRPGSNFVLDMQKASVDCERTLIILSPDFLDSQYTQPEWAAAFRQDPTGEEKLLVPVRVKECDLEGMLGAIGYIDLIGLNEHAAIEALLKGVQRERVKPSRPPRYPGSPEERSFPTPPPFPSGMGEELSVGPEHDDKLTDFLPHPLAAPYAHLLAAEDEEKRFKALDDLLQNTVKYLTAVALSQFWQDNPDRDRLEALLSSISAAHLMTSLTIFNKIGDHYQDASKKPSIYPILFERYRMPVEEGSPLMKADKAIARLEKGSRRAGSEPITPQSFLSHLLAFRQTHWESDPHEIETERRQTLLSPLAAALKQLLLLFTPFFRYPLCYIERVDRDEKDWVYTLFQFPGAEGEPHPVSVPFREQNTEEPSFKPKRLYLCSPQRQPLLNLHPLLIAWVYKIYFFEYLGEEKAIWYCHCCSPERFNAPAYYRFISTRFAKEFDENAIEDEALEDEGDLVDHLEKASEELEKDESAQRIEKMPLQVLFSHLSNEGRQALEIALGESVRIGRFWLGVEFLLMGLSKQKGCFLPDVLTNLGLEPGNLRGGLRGMAGVAKPGWRKQRDVQALGEQAFADLSEIDSEILAVRYQADQAPSAAVTPRMMTVLRQSLRQAGGDKVRHVHLLAAALQHPQSLPVNLLLGFVAEAGVEPRQFLSQLEQHIGGDERGSPSSSDEEKQPDFPERIIQPQRRPLFQGKRGDLLAQAGRDLTAMAKAGQLGPAIGESAHKAMVQIGHILQQTESNNPILLGDPGVGKTAIVEGFAWRLAVGDQHDQPVIDSLANRRIIDLPPAALVAGMKYRGDLEERLQTLLAEVKNKDGQTIIFIDEIHTILGGKAEGGLGTISDMIKPALARGEFPCIGATTVGEYRRYIESDPALARRFTPVWIEEPSIEEAVEIAALVAEQRLAPSHRVLYPKTVVEEAVNLAVRYLHDKFLPGKAIKLLDQAGPRVILGGTLRGAEEEDIPRATGGVVTVEIMRQIVSEQTGIPLTRLNEDESQRLLSLEDTLGERIKGQEEAIQQVVKVVKRSRAGLADPRRPIGVFLFAGPTGVGKTELALALAEALFGDERAIKRLDMSEYMEKHQVSRLIGSPPGYVGYEQEGQLTGHLRRRPYSVVLLDEIEKAHQEVQNLFLQLFDAGRLTDARGNRADGSNAIFIMTTNLGAKKAMGYIEQSEKLPRTVI